MDERREFGRPKVKQRGRDADMRMVSRIGGTIRPKVDAALAKRQRHRIAAAHRWVVACFAGDVFVPRLDWGEKQIVVQHHIDRRGLGEDLFGHCHRQIRGHADTCLNRHNASSGDEQSR